jgi:putative hydrolase of the HAD superfamily
MMIKLLIFDLDNTLFDTYNQLGIEVLDKMIERMKKFGLTKEQESALRQKYHITGFRILAEQLGFSDEMKTIGIETYKSMDLTKIKPFDDVKLIPALKQKKTLVTSGLIDVQMRKVEILGLNGVFDEVVVDESSSHENKQRIFAGMMKKYNAKPAETMIIGDNPESELAAGNNLGIITVQILRRPDMLKGKADYHVKDLHEVEKILKKVLS